jgi:Cu+-exporting ATPase
MSFDGRNIVCFHCGNPCTEVIAEVDGHQFCCHGCLGVYELLRTHDACTYYDFVEGASRPQQKPQSDRYVGFDVAQNEQHVPAGSSRATIEFRIPEMHCAGCVWLLERLHRFDQGVCSSRVNLVQKTVTVVYDASITRPSSLARLLDSLGYAPNIEVQTSDSQRSDTDSRTLYVRLGIAGFAAGNVMMVGLAHYVAGPQGLDPTVDAVLRVIEVGLSIPVLTFCASPWFRSAWGSLRRGVVNLDVPVAVGIFVLFTRSIVDILLGRSEGFLDSFTGLVFFLLIGRLFQQRAIAAIDFERSMQSFFPLSATRIDRENQEFVRIDDLAQGDTVLVRNGEVVPADAVLLHSVGVVDYSYLTGESEPIECSPGTMIYAGGRVMGRSLKLAVVKPSKNSYMASLWSRRDIHMDRTTFDRSRERFGLAFTVTTFIIAGTAALAWLPDMEMAITAFTSVLIIACPCALTLAMPITYSTALGLLATKGIFLKNTSTLSELQEVTKIFFDKTGTLARPRHAEFNGIPIRSSLLKAFGALAQQSTHPLSRAIGEEMPATDCVVTNVEEIPGVGVSCRYGDDTLSLTAQIDDGSHEMFPRESETAMHTVARVNGRIIGQFTMQQKLRTGVDRMILNLRMRGIQLGVLTGDSTGGHRILEPMFDSNEIHCGVRPDGKVQLIQAAIGNGEHVMMVGDGLNDIAAMSAANVSIAVSSGVNRIVPACDVMVDERQVPFLDRLMLYALQQRRVVQVALWFTMLYNALGVYLAVQGMLTPVVTAIMMPLSSLAVIGMSVVGSRLTFRRHQWE